MRGCARGGRGTACCHRQRIGKPGGELDQIRLTAGAGLAWNSPVGPLKFSYGVPLNRKPGDRVQHFQFQVGTVF